MLTSTAFSASSRKERSSTAVPFLPAETAPFFQGWNFHNMSPWDFASALSGAVHSREVLCRGRLTLT